MPVIWNVALPSMSGVFIEAFDLGAIVQSACWRLNALAIFHGGGAWESNHRALAEQAKKKLEEMKIGIETVVVTGVAAKVASEGAGQAVHG